MLITNVIFALNKNKAVRINIDMIITVNNLRNKFIALLWLIYVQWKQ